MRYKNSSGRKCLPSDVTCHCSTSPFTRARIVTRRPFLHAAFAKFRRHTTHSHRAERSTRSPRLGSGAVTWNVTACRGASRRGVSFRGSSSGVSLPSLRVFGGGGVDHGGARGPSRTELVDGAAVRRCRVQFPIEFSSRRLQAVQASIVCTKIQFIIGSNRSEADRTASKETPAHRMKPSPRGESRRPRRILVEAGPWPGEPTLGRIHDKPPGRLESEANDKEWPQIPPIVSLPL